jgi:hypothetical protein
LLPAWAAHAEHLGPSDKDCRDFQTWQQAQHFFASAGGGDPHHLDRDGNGIACESLPGSPSRATPTGRPTATPRPTSTSRPVAVSAPAATATRVPAHTLMAIATPTMTGESSPSTGGDAAPTAVPLRALPPGSGLWLLAFEAVPLYLDDGEVFAQLEPGTWHRVIALAGDWALIRVGLDKLSAAWIRLDSPVRLRAEPLPTPAADILRDSPSQ